MRINRVIGNIKDIKTMELTPLQIEQIKLVILLIVVFPLVTAILGSLLFKRSK